MTKITFELLLLILIEIPHFAVKAQRSMVMTSWFGTGTRNVKYETIGNNVIDANGQLISQKLNARKNAKGQMIYDCTDVTGKLRINGEEYERPNGNFRYKCENGIEIITACIGSERTGKSLIKAGQILNKDGFWHKCTHFPNNQTAVYTEETACNVNDKLYHVGDDIYSAFFRMKCGENGYKIIGCYYTDERKTKVDMKPGTTVKLGGQIHHCDNNGGNIQYYTTDSDCTKNGMKYVEGEQFSANHLRYQCQDGLINIIGCYVGESERNIEIGDSFVDKNMIYRCYFDNGAIKYEEYPCGLKNMPPCKAPPKQQVDLIAVSKIRPGFKGFSIAQLMNRNGDTVISGSDTVKLSVKTPDGLQLMQHHKID